MEVWMDHAYPNNNKRPKGHLHCRYMYIIYYKMNIYEYMNIYSVSSKNVYRNTRLTFTLKFTKSITDKKYFIPIVITSTCTINDHTDIIFFPFIERHTYKVSDT